MKRKLVVLDGADGIGKSTQCEMLAKRLNAKVLQQPNSNNCVGFIRQMMKQLTSLNSDDRQYLAAISHAVDAYTQFHGHDNLVMDRSYLSALVYGKLTGANEDKLNIILKALRAIYKQNILDLNENPYDIHFVFISRESRYDQADDDVFEKTTKWEQLRDAYKEVFDKMVSKQIDFVGNEKVHFLNVSDMSVEEIHNIIWDLIK